jgi:hypothetical protein
MLFQIYLGTSLNIMKQKYGLWLSLKYMAFSFLQIKLLIANVGWEGLLIQSSKWSVVVLLQIECIFIHLTICPLNNGHVCELMSDYSFSLSWLVISSSLIKSCAIFFLLYLSQITFNSKTCTYARKQNLSAKNLSLFICANRHSNFVDVTVSFV